MTMTPIITGYGPAVRADTMQVVGSGFGRVSSAALQDVDGNRFTCDFIVDTGSSLHLTVPKLLPNGTYFVVLGTLDNIPSQNTAVPFVLDGLPTSPPSPPPPPEPMPDPASAAVTAIRAWVRREIADYAESFEASVQADGVARRFELPQRVIDPASLQVVVLTPAGANYTSQALGPGSDYTLYPVEGVIVTTVPPPDDSLLSATGTRYQFFTDEELDLFIRTAAFEHTHGVESLQVYRDINNFKHFLYGNATVDTIPPVEYHPLSLLASVKALEVIRSDATFDIDVTTSDGTSLPREERFRNLGELIETKQARYDDVCRKLGVGLGRIEVFTARRVSRTTGRLVPVFVAREYDDVRTPPLRLFTPRNLGITGSGFTQDDPFAYYGASGP